MQLHSLTSAVTLNNHHHDNHDDHVCFFSLKGNQRNDR